MARWRSAAIRLVQQRENLAQVEFFGLGRPFPVGNDSDEVISENSRPKALRPVLSFSLMNFLFRFGERMRPVAA